jgi:hypothetical protein
MSAKPSNFSIARGAADPLEAQGGHLRRGYGVPRENKLKIESSPLNSAFPYGKDILD